VIVFSCGIYTTSKNRKRFLGEYPPKTSLKGLLGRKMIKNGKLRLAILSIPNAETLDDE
jgi:hypothetical protein